jgi:hypothetical protein
MNEMCHHVKLSRIAFDFGLLAVMIRSECSSMDFTEPMGSFTDSFPDRAGRV